MLADETETLTETALATAAVIVTATVTATQTVDVATVARRIAAVGQLQMTALHEATAAATRVGAEVEAVMMTDDTHAEAETATTTEVDVEDALVHDPALHTDLAAMIVTVETVATDMARTMDVAVTKTAPTDANHSQRTKETEGLYLCNNLQPVCVPVS